MTVSLKRKRGIFCSIKFWY